MRSFDLESARRVVKLNTDPSEEATGRVLNSKADGLAGRLSAVGLRVAAVDHASGLAGVYSLIRGVADAAGVSDRGRDLAARVEKRVAELRESGAAGPRPRVLLIVGRRPGTLTDIVAVGSDYLVGVSAYRPFNIGRDVFVIDRRRDVDHGEAGEG